MCSPPFREANFFSCFSSHERKTPASSLSGAMSFCQGEASSGGSSASLKKEAEARVAEDEEEEQAGRGPIGRRSRAGSSVTDISSNGSINYRKARQDKIGSDGFWCGALCMHIPGLSRRRPMMQQQQSMSLSEADTRASTAGPGEIRASTVSKAASMERFKYSSSSAGIVFEGADEEEEEEVSAYFDLPLELLRISSVDTESPVTAAFVFDGSRVRGAEKIVPEMPEFDFSFPAPPAFSSPSSPSS